MKNLSLTTKHCPSFAAIWLHAAGVLSFRFMVNQWVKYSPNTGTGDRLQEVRG